MVNKKAFALVHILLVFGFIIVSVAGNNSECKKGRIVTPGVTKISCSSKSVSAENVADYFVMHFNENGYVNYYNKKNAKIDENLKFCCLVKNSNPKKGQTYIYGDNKNNIIKITTNVGSKLSKDVYLTNTVDWPGKDFKWRIKHSL